MPFVWWGIRQGEPFQITMQCKGKDRETLTACKSSATGRHGQRQAVQWTGSSAVDRQACGTQAPIIDKIWHIQNQLPQKVSGKRKTTTVIELFSERTETEIEQQELTEQSKQTNFVTKKSEQNTYTQQAQKTSQGHKTDYENRLEHRSIKIRARNRCADTFRKIREWNTGHDLPTKNNVICFEAKRVLVQLLSSIHKYARTAKPRPQSP